MQRSRKQNIQLFVGIAISLLSIAAIFLIIDPAEILSALRTANYANVLLAALGLVVYFIFRAVRWRFLMNDDLTLGRVFHVNNLGYMITQILPFRLGDLARAVMIGNVPPMTVARGLSTMVVERLLDVLFFVTLLPFSLASIDEIPAYLQTAARSGGFIALLGIGVLIIAANQRKLVHSIGAALLKKVDNREKWLTQLDEILSGLDKLTTLKGGLLTIVYSIVVWLPVIFAYNMCLQAVGLDLPLPMVLFTVCVAAFSVAAPSSPGQVGVFHAAVTLGLTTVLNQAEAPSASFAFIYHTLNFVMSIIVGIVGLYFIGETWENILASTRGSNSKS